MSIYRVQASVESVRYATVTDFSELPSFDGAPISRPLPTVDIVGRGKLRDFIYLKPGVVVCNLKARDLLRSNLGGDVEFVEIKSNVGGPYFLLNVLRVVDALDKTRSSIKRFPDSERVKEISKYAFQEKTLLGLSLFKLPENPSQDIYATTKFLEYFREVGLTGLDFCALN